MLPPLYRHARGKEGARGLPQVLPFPTKPGAAKPGLRRAGAKPTRGSAADAAAAAPSPALGLLSTGWCCNSSCSPLLSVLAVSQLGLNAINLSIDVSLLMTALDKHPLRSGADLCIKVRHSKATGHVFSAVWRYSPHVRYCRSS